MKKELPINKTIDMNTRDEMYLKIGEICNNYYLTVDSKDNNFTIKRGMESMVIFKEFNEDGEGFSYDFFNLLTYEDLENTISKFCNQTKLSFDELKTFFPKKIRLPNVGEFIAVKRNDEYNGGYQVRKFKKMKNKKIVCKNKIKRGSGEFDYYQILVGDNHPSQNLWLNSYGVSVTEEEIENNNTYDVIEIV